MKTFSSLGFNLNQPIFFQLNFYVTRNVFKVIRIYLWLLPFAYLGSIFILFERFEKGERWLLRCWQWNKKQPVFLALLGIHFEQVQKFMKALTVWKLFHKYYSEDLPLFLRMAHTKNQINLQLESISILNKLLDQYNSERDVVDLQMALSNAFEAHKEYQKAFEILENLHQKKLLNNSQKENLILKAYRALHYEKGDAMLAELPFKELKLDFFVLDLWNEKNEKELMINKINQIVQEYPKNKNVLWRQYTIYANHFYNSKDPFIGNQLENMLNQLEKIKNWYEPRILNEKIRLAILQQQHDKALKLISKLPNNHSKFVLKVKMWEAHIKGNYELEKKLWRLFKQLYFVPQIQYPQNQELMLISGNPNLTKPDDIPLFTCIKNELDRLKWFMAYYRNLGVTRFFFIDNDSTDGSTEYLKKQSDVALFWTTEKYARGYSGIKWINHLIKQYAKNYWTLYTDVDEALVYPNSEQVSLQDFTKTLELKGYQALHAPMLDMFQLSNEKNTGTTPEYTTQYPFYLVDRKTIGTLRPPYLSDFGGIRKYFKVYEAHTKIPLIHSKHKIQFLNSSHNITPARVFSYGGVLLHYKMVNNFIEKTQNELLKPGRISACMARLKSYLDRTSNISYQEINNHPDLRTYTRSLDLIEEGLIKPIQP